MNNEYIYTDEKAIIRNDSEDKEPIRYYNELDNVLEQENLIETIENKIELLEKEKKNIRITSLGYALSPVIIGFLTPIISMPIFSLLGITIPYNTIVNTIFGPMSNGIFLTTVMSSCFSIFAAGFTIPLLMQRSQDKKHLNGLDSELKYLKKIIEKEHNKLDELNNNKNYEHKNKDFRIVKINDESIKNLDTKLKLYYSCGYNNKKYSIYFKKHKRIPKELVELFKNGETEIIIEFLEENGPKLVKRK